MCLFECGYRKEDGSIDILATAKALFDPVRFKMLKLVEARELCVCELTDALGVSQPRASQHLRQLKRTNLVMERREGKWVYYSANPKAIQEFRTLLSQYFDTPDGGIPGFECLREALDKRENPCQGKKEVH